MTRTRWPGAAIAALLLAACAQKPAPRNPVTEMAFDLMSSAITSTMLCTPRRPLPSTTDTTSLSSWVEDREACREHLQQALDILEVRCRGLPPAESPPQVSIAARRQAEDPSPDPLLVHLCAVLPWQDRSGLARLL